VVIDNGPGHAVLFDCGRMRDPTVGRRIVAPALWDRGVRTIDAVILSHADADHYNGLPDLLDRFPVRAVYVPPGFASDPGGGELLALLTGRGVRVETVASGRLWYRDADDRHFVFQVRHPPADWDATRASDNARSVVLAVHGGPATALLTGDLDGPGLTALIDDLARAARPDRLDAVLSPHHGGRTANPEWFYTQLDPARVVVSQRPPAAGTRDPLEPVEAGGRPVLRTWQRGAIRLRWTPGGIEAHGFADH
jgi:competence protein ComEC